MSTHARDALKRIGRKLRQTRQERGLTLAQVGVAAGVSRAFLSQLELGETSASVSSLLRICEALGLNLSTLFEAPQVALVRRGDRVPSVIGEAGVVNYALTPQWEGRAQLFETHIEPGGGAGEEKWAHSGELAIAHVLKGSLELRLDEERIVLRTGDALTFDPKVPHTWCNPSQRTEAVVLLFDVPATLSGPRSVTLWSAGGVTAEAASRPD